MIVWDLYAPTGAYEVDDEDEKEGGNSDVDLFAPTIYIPNKDDE